MRIYSIKQNYFITLLLVIIACFFEACKEEVPKPLPGTDTVKKDSIVVKDTLPSFNSPVGIAVDGAGNLYVADYGNNLIRKITGGGLVSTFAGSGMQGSLNGAANVATFNEPTGIAVDVSGNLYVADAGNNRIRKISSAGAVSTLAGVDSTGSVNGPGAGASFFDPLGVAVDGAGNVYVADAGNNMVRMITPAGIVSTLAGNSVSVSNGALTNTSFNNPTGVAVDILGNVYVADYLNNIILEVNQAGTVTTLAGKGQTGANNGPDSSATFYYPNSVAVDAANNVYVADGVNNLIRKITPAGMVTTLAGSGIAGAIDSTGTAASFNGPSGLVVDAAGNVYVADTNNNLIRKITSAGVVTTIAGTGKPGAKNGLAIAKRNKKLLKNTSKNRFNIFYKRKLS
ncbi:MAG TPA: NHL repeat-containing protein [Mucilaginibacter sp.]|jgi:sugar lactone lactonase YvrE